MPLPPLSWDHRTTPAPLHRVLETLAGHYPIVEGGGGHLLRFITSDAGSLQVRHERDGSVVISHRSLPAATRGIGCALAGIDADANTEFTTFGIMLDCSRNAVMDVSSVKRWLRQLALLGYDTLMLYTEDTYQLPGEPYFGYMRGGYSLEEVRAIDAYATALGIRVVACIQTLGHLGQIFKWPRFAEVKDTQSVLLADSDKTYDLIGKMLDFWSEALGSRRIHVGMDEAHDLGRGRFMDLHGPEPAFAIFNRHLARVCGLCEERGLKPMIWSDMYFRMGNPAHDYYNPETVIPESTRKLIPRDVDLVYWDYYHEEESFYTDWIRRHRALGHEPVMASGIWTWRRFWYDHAMTTSTVRPCLAACRKAGVREVFFTMWGDGGSYCEFDSAFAGLAWAADLAYGGDGASGQVAPLLAAVCGNDLDTVLLGSEIQPRIGPGIPTLPAITIIWDDPLIGIGAQGFDFAGPEYWPQVLEKLRPVRAALAPFKSDPGPPDMAYIWHLCDVMIRKIEFRQALLPAYRSRDWDKLKELREGIPEILASLDGVEQAFRRQWLRRNKPLGMEVVQIRLGALSVRFREAGIRIGELIDGTVSCLPEIDSQPENLGANVVDVFAWLAGTSLSI